MHQQHAMSNNMNCLPSYGVTLSMLATLVSMSQSLSLASFLPPKYNQFNTRDILQLPSSYG